MNTQTIVAKINLFSVLLFLIFFSAACNEAKTGKATYTFTNQVSEEFMQKERETAEVMAGEDEELLKEVMEHIRKTNTKRVYSLFFQGDKSVFSMDTEWNNGQEDPNKIYIDYQSKQIIRPREGKIRREPFTKAKWQITDETKKMGKWDVQKATAEFDGQTITAWFAKDDLRISPRGYAGLDGVVVELILEAGAKYTLTNLEFDKSIKVDLP